MVTYQLTAKEGAVYAALKDKGLRPVAFVPGKSNPGGNRKGTGKRSACQRRTGKVANLAQMDKVRWECGKGALPAKWSLVGRAL